MYSCMNDDETLEIIGNVAELNQIACEIIRLGYGETYIIKMFLNNKFKTGSTPIHQITLRCNDSKINFSVSAQSLVMEFSCRLKEIAASYFSYFTNDSVDGDHCHFDKYFREEFFEDESIDLVIRYKGETNGICKF